MYFSKVFPDAADPALTSTAVIRLSSNSRSNCMDETVAPWGLKLTGTLIPVSPGFPEALPADSVAVACAAALPVKARNKTKSSTNERVFLIIGTAF